MEKFVKVHVMHTGDVKYDRALAFKQLDVIPPVNQRGQEYQELVPVSCYLIEHPNGRIVVDAGWHEDIRTQPKEHFGEDLYQFIEYRLPEGRSVREQLATKNITPQDIYAVVMTHQDEDHISGLQHLIGAKRFLVSEPEWRNCADGLIYLVFTPGHTDGHVSVLARVEKGWLLLVSDVGYAEKSWKELILPGNTVDEQQALESLQWVQYFLQRSDCVAAIANHDPSVRPVSY
ncbi:N-acyl homoserine lactonase family protein [Peribacillus muralis]|uniref:N-acyl homoserine lactonase family protein n=1 Tax=Peribacillus muralis TaxID=264697 RepID=UPI001F4E104A|nr:N-acyl homoserine lactonase family protein [Peribacillus muralis]MCK1995325.1 N-acyl homoserine lactonase family protein [Peribacillus muralis]MCK2015919.1 N-acyl homoserine lactonase family protein [Peribacillus muralis]